jgi:hypothetical protein
MSATASTVLVDVEIYDGAGHKVFQRSWDNQSLRADRPRTYNVKWSVPGTAGPGEYSVKIGIFKTGWSALYNWNDNAAHFTVT